jgi:hypothetical protein
MMSRCYKETTDSYNIYGGSGVTVCDFWKDEKNCIDSIWWVARFDKFYNFPYNYQLDKDYFQQDIPKHKRIYSPETCIFLNEADNANLALYERHRFFIYGVYEDSPGLFTVRFMSNGKRVNFGTYTTRIAAGNEYNYYYSLYGEYEIVPLFNKGIPQIMTHEEAQKYLVKR